ncbi:sensor histidine kinase [Candidatus Woesearchaeota archaeon]|nr:sensor histidine kinase [Candidatus Woesearchaeota archaeon]
MGLSELLNREDIPEDAKDIIRKDIRKHEEYEQQLEEKAQKEHYSIGSIAHDINNCLTGSLGLLSLLKNYNTPNDFSETLEAMKKGIDHMRALTMRLLKIGNTEDIKPYSISTALKFAKYINDTKAQEKGIRIVYNPVPEGIEDNILTDQVRLDQILCNLVGNAVKFTHQGSVTLGVVKKDDATLEFYVRDTGIGIPEDKLGIIFRPNTQVCPGKYEGEGLGLSIAEKNVELLRGKIRVESGPEGSTFYFTHPYKPAGNPQENTQSDSSNHTL